MAIDFVFAADTGIAIPGSTPNPNTRPWTAASGAVPTVVTVGSELGKFLRWTMSATDGRLSRPITGTERTIRMLLHFTALPDGDCTLIQCTASAGNSPSLLFRTATSDIIASVGTTTTGATAVSVTTGVVYEIEWTGNVASGTRTSSLTVDGVDKGTASAAIAASAFTFIRVGGSCGGAAVTGTVDIGHIVATDANADYPSGVGRVACLFANRDGTHNYNAATDFTDTADANIDPSSTTIHELLDHAVDSISDFLRIKAASGEYVEVGFDSLPAASSIRAMMFLGGFHASGTGANRTSLRLVDGAITDDIATDADFSNTGLTYFEKIYTALPAGGMTKAQIDALLLRIASSFGTVDINAVPFVDGVFLAVEYVPDTGGGGAVISPYYASYYYPKVVAA